ncbi:MAG: amino acid permease [Nocardioidaceae bacterium]|nr:amino acid permease [Nocardioidaceae bacterium]
MTNVSPDGSASEEHVVNEFGYRQELRRTLRQFSVFAVAFSIISITTGIFLNYSFAFSELGPASIWTWPLAAVGQTLVVLVLAELATRIPLAGANYQWASRLVGPTYGWFVGALGILNLAVGLPGIMLLAASPLLEYVLGIAAPSPRLTLFLALLILTVAYLINVISVQVAARVNNIAVFTEILGTVVLAVGLFVLWVAGYKDTGHGIGYLGHAVHPPGQSYFYAIVLASLLGIYTIVAFETAADMSEEAVDAQRSVPRAMIGAVVISAVLGMIVLIGFTIAIPSDAVIAEGGLPGVFQYWIGSGLARTFVGIVVFSMFALTVVGAAASARLLFAMARDNMLPGSKAIARVNRRTLTPLPALLVSYTLCVAVMVYGYNSGNAFGTLVGATALAPYLVYLLTVIAYGAKRRRLETLPGAFNLGRFAVPVFVAALVWLVAAVLALSLPSEFHKAVYYVVGGLVLATLWWLFALRPRIKKGAAGPMMVRDVAASDPSAESPSPTGR